MPAPTPLAPANIAYYQKRSRGFWEWNPMSSAALAWAALSAAAGFIPAAVLFRCPPDERWHWHGKHATDGGRVDRNPIGHHRQIPSSMRRCNINS
jgi:hypothetical protein